MKGIRNNNDIIGWIGRSYFNQSGAGSKSRRFQDGGKATASPEPLSYGVSLRFIRNLENPHGKGLKNGRYFPYSDGSRAFGLGTDILTNTTGKKLARRAYKEGIPMQEAHDIAVRELRNQDRVIMQNLVDEGYTTRPDTISHGVRLLGAQARYQRGNIKPIFHEWARAVIDGNADRQKEIIGRYSKGDDRRNKIATFDPYYYQGGWHSERERKGYAPKKQDGGTFPMTNMGNSGFDAISRLTKRPYISSDGITPDNPLFWVAVERLRSIFSPKQQRGQGGGGGAGSRFNPDTQYVDTVVKDTIYLPMQRTFNDAFGEARRRGLNEFIFQGKRYNTNMGNNPNNNAAGMMRTEEYAIPIEREKRIRKVVDKKQDGGRFEVKSDNTRIERPRRFGKVKQKKKERRQSRFESDDRSEYQRDRDAERSKIKRDGYEQEKRQEKALRDLNGFLMFSDAVTLPFGIGVAAVSVARAGLRKGAKKAISANLLDRKPIPSGSNDFILTPADFELNKLHTRQLVESPEWKAKARAIDNELGTKYERHMDYLTEHDPAVPKMFRTDAEFVDDITKDSHMSQNKDVDGYMTFKERGIGSPNNVKIRIKKEANRNALYHEYLHGSDFLQTIRDNVDGLKRNVDTYGIRGELMKKTPDRKSNWRSKEEFMKIAKERNPELTEDGIKYFERIYDYVSHETELSSQISPLTFNNFKKGLPLYPKYTRETMWEGFKESAPLYLRQVLKYAVKDKDAFVEQVNKWILGGAGVVGASALNNK